MIPAAKLDRLLDRFAALEAEMASGASGEAFVKLSREHAELSPVIETAQAYRTAQIQLADTEAMIDDPGSDSDMRVMAEQERADLRAQLLARKSASAVEEEPWVVQVRVLPFH